MDISFSKISNIAVFRLSHERDSKSHLVAFERLFLTLAALKQYTIVDTKIIKQDFTDVFGLSLNAMFISEFINRLKNDGYITKNRIDRELYFDREKINQLNLIDALNAINSEISTFVTSFMSFSKKNDIVLTKDEAEDIICHSIENIVCATSFKEDAKIKPIKASHKYVFDLFLQTVRESDEHLFVIYQKMIYGRVYASFIAEKEITNDSSMIYKDLKLYLDSGFVFRALGLDYYSNRDEYVDIIEALKSIGVQLLIFDHTYREMESIIKTAIDWIDNSDYNQYLASRTATYFVLSKTSKADANQMLYELKDDIQKLGITIDSDFDISYSEEEGIEVTNIENAIINEYKRLYVYDENKYESYQNDAKSLFQILRLRNYQFQGQFGDVKYLFVTTNSTLARVSADLNNVRFFNRGIPCAITDNLLSVLAWFSTNNYQESANLMFLIPSAYHAFEPTVALLEKMDSVFKDMKEKHLMTDKAVLDWMSDTGLQQSVISYTKNDPDNFDESTPSEIMRRKQKQYNGIIDPYLEELKGSLIKCEKRINRNNLIVKIVFWVLYVIVFVGIYFGVASLVGLLGDKFVFLSPVIEGVLLLITSVLLLFVPFEDQKYWKRITNFCASKINSKTVKAIKEINDKIEDISNFKVE